MAMERVEPTTVQASVDAMGFGGPGIPGPEAARPKQTREPEPGLSKDNPLELQFHAIETLPRGGRWAFTLAGLFCLFWAGGIGAYMIGYALSPSGQSLSATWWAVMLGAIGVPCAMAWFVAMLIREARQLRAQARAMTHAAGALVQPQDHAARGVAKLGQTVRRELDLFNAAMDAAIAKLAALETNNSERLEQAERTVASAQERVDRAAQRLTAEREKLQSFAQSLDHAVDSVADTLNTRLTEARTAARAAAESLDLEKHTITNLLDQLSAVSAAATARAGEISREFDRQAQKLESAAEAATARSEQVLQRHERHRAGLQETLERLKSENDNMTRALEGQRDSLSKLVGVMGEEAKRVDALANDGVRRIDNAASAISQRIVDTAQTLASEIDRLKTQSELSSAGIGQAVDVIRSAGDTSYDSASRLGAQLSQLSESAAKAAIQVDAGITRLQQFMADLPRDVMSHAEQLRGVVEGQALAINDLSGRIANAYDQLQSFEVAKPAKPTPASLSPSQTNGLSRISAPSTTPTPQASNGLNGSSGLSPSISQGTPSATFTPKPTTVPTGSSTVKPINPSLTERSSGATSTSPAEVAQRGDPAAAQEIKGWLGIAKRLVRLGGPEDTGLDTPPPRGWEMKQLLQAAEQAGQAETPAAIAARHAIESLQALAIDIDRFLEDDPPLDYLRRYRAGERDIFARRLLQVISRDTTERLSRKYKNDAEFREVVDRYCGQFETLMADMQTGGSDPAKSEAALNAPVGKVYMALARISGKI